MDDVLHFLAQTLRIATPLLFAALAGVLSERAGVIALGLEGFLLSGAYGAMAAAHASGNAGLGVLAAIGAGAAIASLHALACVRFRANQIVVGIATNLFALGLTRVFLKLQFDSSSNSPRIPGVEALVSSSDPLSLLGVLTHPIIFAALACIPALALLLARTPFGLRMRACGESPEMAESLGLHVARIQWAAVLGAGALAGAGGAFLSLDQHQFTDAMSAGRGFIALAAVIFGRWHPLGAALACLLFASAEALQIRLQGGQDLPSQLVQIIPYALTLVALVGVVGRSVAPFALGKARED
jgi:simple sugar transport system permease protein